MTRPDILSMIDQAVDDWENGPDAMRWSPEPPSAPQHMLGGFLRYDHGDGYTIIDETHAWTAEDVYRFMDQALGVTLDAWQEDTFRYWLNGRVA